MNDERRVARRVANDAHRRACDERQVSLALAIDRSLSVDRTRPDRLQGAWRCYVLAAKAWGRQDADDLFTALVVLFRGYDVDTPAQ